MPISHVVYGKEADPTHQNALIDQVNQNTSDITTLQGEVAGKAELCSDLPVDTGITPAVGSSAKASPCDHKHRAVGSTSPQAPGESASAGTQSLASRQDHVHPGVAKIIAGTGIGVSPASGRGEVTVTCTAAPGGITKVEKTFDGTFNAGDELCSDTPAADELPVAIYAELTTVSGGLEVFYYIDDVEAGPGYALDAAGDFMWAYIFDMQAWYDNETWNDWRSCAKAWKLGRKISLKAYAGGTGSGKLIIYYATIT